MSLDGVEVPCSTRLTIGDVVIPVPDFAVHPERVVWAPPGVDHTAPYLHPAGAATAGGAAGFGATADPTRGLPSLAADGTADGAVFFSVQDPLTRRYLRWMAQKEQLGQDMCLVGDPGPAMRWLVMLYSHLTRREIRVVYLNSDITEGDLKQRREIRNGSLVYDDQSAVTAAVEGQLLVLEGLERVERNVLPVINNLLENREMHLDNGAVLIHPARYDALLQQLYESKLQQQHQLQHREASRTSATTAAASVTAALMAEAKNELSQMGLVRVSEKFRVVGITVPVPPYDGNPLDPPLRSRFQCLYVRTPMPVIAPSSTVVAALRDGSRDERLATPLVGRGVTSKTAAAAAAAAAALEERQAVRFAQVAQLRAALLAINDATRDFQLSRPSKKRPAPAAGATSHGGARRRNPYVPMHTSTDVVEELFGPEGGGEPTEDDADAPDDGRSAAAASSPLQTMGHWALATIAQQLALFPDLPVGEAVARSLPWPYYARQLIRGGGGGGSSAAVGGTGLASVEEYQRRLAQYAEVLQHCHVYPPLLMSADLATRGAERRAPSSPASPSRQGRSPRGHAGAESPGSVTARVGERLRAVVHGSRAEGGDAAAGAGAESRGAAAARAYVRSAQLVSASSTVAASASTMAPRGGEDGGVPLGVQQTCNYITAFRHLATTATFSGVPVVVAEAEVATAAHDAAQPGQPGTYTLRVFMGPQALAPAQSAAAAASGWAVLDFLATTAAPDTVFTTEHYHVLQTMLQVHASRQHLCLLGPTGCGKTAMVRAFGRLLGYAHAMTMHLYADMTHKDLFQQRMTDPKTGNTTWRDSPLLHAAIYGELVVLDGMEKLPGGMLASLQQILVDQSAVLADGTTLKSPHEYELLKDRLTRRDPATGAVLWRPSEADMRARRIFPVHPCFRAVATARPPMPVSGGGGGASGGGRGGARDFFVSPDLTTLFRVVGMPDAGEDALGPVLRQVALAEARAMQAEHAAATGCAAASAVRLDAAVEQRCAAVVDQLLQLRGELERLHATDGKMPQLSLRQLRLLVRAAVRYPSRTEESVRNTLLLPLMTGVAALKVAHALEACGLAQSLKRSAGGRSDAGAAAADGAHEVLVAASPSTEPPDGARVWTVNGAAVVRLTRPYTQAEQALVPYVAGFHANRVHESMLAWLAKQYAMGSNVLLIGHQGVGKNKVVDAFLARLGIPRHYIQLHRDTTVGSLTINPTVEAGKVVWDDSPLVKAVQRGHCLVVDEIDKAPVEVVQVLKGLIEDREMRLGDGRLICDAATAAAMRAQAAVDGDEEASDAAAAAAPSSSSLSPARPQCIAIHPDFRIIVLANPPGFPFHGNDFFRECGDLFAAYVMGNPDAESQLRVLTAYAPTLPRALLVRLVQVFMELQHAFTQGNLTYPFSLRELIAVVKHMARFPQDGIYEALNNVFNFDAREENTLRLVRQVLAAYLQPMIQQGGLQRLRPYKAGQPTPLVPFRELITLPMTSTAAAAGAARGGDAARAHRFASLVVLPSAVTLTSSALLSRTLSNAEPQAEGSLPATAAGWEATYPIDAFFTNNIHNSGSRGAPTAPDAADDAEAFTEWASRCALPFVDRRTDAVLAVTSVAAVRGGVDGAAGEWGQGGADDSSAAASLTLLSVLLLRRSTGDASPPRLLAATVRLPPTSIDAHHLVADAAEELAALWPVGLTRFVDVSGDFAAELSEPLAPLGPATSAAFVFTSLRMTTHALPWCVTRASEPRLVWPASLATWSSSSSQGVGAPRASLLAHGSSAVGVHAGATPPSWAAAARAPQGVVLISSRATGRTVLVDVLGGASSDLYAARMGSGHEATDTDVVAANPVLPLHLAQCVDPAAQTTRATVRVLDVSARHGIVCFASADTASRDCFLLREGRVVRVTLPQPVTAARLVGPQLVMVEMRPSGGSSASAGVLKVTLMRDGADGVQATMLPLGCMDGPQLKLVEAPAVDSAAASADASARGVVELVPADLQGAVWQVVQGPGTHASASSTSPSSSSPASAAEEDADRDDPAGRHVMYARVEDISAAEGLQLRYFKSKSSAAAAAAVTLVDDARHQLVQVHLGGRTVSAVDTAHGTVRTFAASSPTTTASSTTCTSTASPAGATAAPAPAAAAAAAAALVSLDAHGGALYDWDAAAQRLSVADVDGERVRQRYAEWSSLFSGNAASVADAAAREDGEDDDDVRDFKMEYSTPRKQPSGTLKHGEVDDKEHHGGNTWAGGTGGTDTAGLGGIIGPYRLDKGNPVHQVSPEEKRKVPKYLRDEARRMGREALRERLHAIGMSEEEYAQYKTLQDRVRPAVAQLRTLLMGLKAAEGERVWVTGQTDGVWDDKKLVEGIVGEKNVYKRRVDSTETNPFQQRYKKRLVFVLDVSASMYRFNGMDQRLTKLLETTVMVMEAFAGFESKLDYAMIGHNGDSDNIPLVHFGAAPANQKERMIVCQKMMAYAQYCWSGDNTVEAMRRSVELVTKEKGDSYFVFVISDANLRQYGITPRELTDIIQSKPEVKMFCIFIATLGAQASHLQQQLPAGHGFECMRTDALPHVMRQIFTSANLF